MVRIFLSSPLSPLMQVTPWATTKVSLDRTATPIHWAQRILTFGVCLLFWKTLLPLSIGLVVWYQLANTLNNKIQDEIERIEKTPRLLASLVLLPETKDYLVQRGKIVQDDLRYKYLPLKEAKLHDNDRLRQLFPELPVDQQYALANSSDANLLWALELDAKFATRLTFNVFEKPDAIAAAAFEHLPIETLRQQVNAAKQNSLKALLCDPDSLLTRAIANNQDADRLKAFASVYPLEILRILPQERWEQLGEMQGRLLEAKSQVEADLKQLRIHELLEQLNQDTVNIQQDDHDLLPTLYSQCSADQKPKLLQAIHTQAEALNQLHASFEYGQCDFSFVDNQWLSTIFPQLSVSLRAAIICNAMQKTNQLQRILNNAPLDSWKEFAQMPNPRHLLISVAHKLPIHHDYVILETSLQQFQQIISEGNPDPYALMRIVAHQPDKVRWLIEHFQLDASQVADALAAQNVTAEEIQQIARGPLLDAYYRKCPIPRSLAQLSAGEAVPQPAAATNHNNQNITAYLSGRATADKVRLYQALANNDSKTITDLNSKLKPSSSFGQSLASTLALLASSPIDAASSIIQAPTRFSAEQWMLIILEHVPGEEIAQFVTIAPGPVFICLATKQQDLTQYVTQDAINKMSAEELAQVGQILYANQQNNALMSFAGCTSIEKLIQNPHDRSQFYQDMTLTHELIQHMSADEIRFIIERVGTQPAIEALFSARPQETLQQGGALVANLVKETDAWKHFPIKDLLALQLSSSIIVGKPITEERLKEVLHACKDSPPADLLAILETEQQIGWAVEILPQELAADLLVAKIGPKDTLESIKLQLHPDQERTQDHALRCALLEKYAHLIPVERISRQLLCFHPERALTALLSQAATQLTQEQRNAWIKAGAESEDVVRAVRKRPEDLEGYFTNGPQQNFSQLWLAVEDLDDNNSLLDHIATIAPHSYPMPQGQKQWHRAIQVGTFKRALPSMIAKWRSTSIQAYEEQLSHIQNADRQAMIEALQNSFWGRSIIAQDLGVQVSPTQATPRSHTPSPIFLQSDSPLETPIQQTSPPQDVWDLEATPLPQTPQTAARAGYTLPMVSPLAQLFRGQRMQAVRPMSLLNQAEQLAQKVIKNTLTLEQALEQNSQFIQQLPTEFTEDFDDTSFLLGQLCLKLTLQQLQGLEAANWPEERKQAIYLFLASPEHQLLPDDPKLLLFQSNTSRQSVVHSPLPQRQGNIIYG